MALAITGSDDFAIETYAGLLAWIANVLDRGDLEEEIPNFVRLAEYSMERRILNIQRQKTTTITASAKTANLPNDFKQMVRLGLSGEDAMEQRPQAALGNNGETGEPCRFSIGNGKITLSPTPDGTYNLDCEYIAGISKLSDNTVTNSILVNHADAYCYGALVQAEAFLTADERLGLWKAAYDEAIAEINAQGLRYRTSAKPFRLRNPTGV